MKSLPLALVFSAGVIAMPLAGAQTPTDQTPKTRPAPMKPDDAEHAPTRKTTPPGKGVARPDAAKKEAEARNPPRQSKDDAEHAPTQKTDGDAPAATGADRKEPSR